MKADDMRQPPAPQTRPQVRHTKPQTRPAIPRPAGARVTKDMQNDRTDRNKGL